MYISAKNSNCLLKRQESKFSNRSHQLLFIELFSFMRTNFLQLNFFLVFDKNIEFMIITFYPITYLYVKYSMPIFPFNQFTYFYSFVKCPVQL